MHDHLVRTDLVPDAAVIIDAGACFGEFAQFFADTKARVILIECCPPHVKELLKNPRYEVVEAALVGEGYPSEVEFRWGLNAPVRGNIVGEWGIALGQMTIVPTTTLRVLLDKCGINRVDLLKLDIEGAEAGLLRTLTPDLARRIHQIAVEIHPGSISMDEAQDILVRLGFEVVRDDRRLELNAVRNDWPE